MRHAYAVILFLLFTPSSLLAGGHVFNENFSVLTPAEPTRQEAQAYAEQVLDRAETFRQEIAREWLGAELPTGIGRTHINVSFSDTEDSGLTWPVSGPRRTAHKLMLKTSPEQALGSTLKHEMCHVVLATRFPRERALPAWIEEGIASRYDDGQRGRTRHEILQWWCDTGNWPSIREALDSDRLSGDDQVAYTLATSIVDFLLSQRDKQTLVAFAQHATDDLSGALQKHYQIHGLDDLQDQWQVWTQRKCRQRRETAGFAE